MAVVASCGGSSVDDEANYVIDDSTARGTLIRNPRQRVATYEPNALARLLESLKAGSDIHDASGSPVCSVDFHRIEYQTVDPSGNPKAASGVLMIPAGDRSGCSGPRPIVAYAHGASTDKRATTWPTPPTPTTTRSTKL